MATKKTTTAKAAEKTVTKKTTTAKAVEAKAVETKAVETKAVETKAVETKAKTLEAKADAAAKAPVVEKAAKAAPSREAIAKRAFELFVARGGQNGNAFEDWVRAERELTAH